VAGNSESGVSRERSQRSFRNFRVVFVYKKTTTFKKFVGVDFKLFAFSVLVGSPGMLDKRQARDRLDKRQARDRQETGKSSVCSVPKARAACTKGLC